MGLIEIIVSVIFLGTIIAAIFSSSFAFFIGIIVFACVIFCWVFNDK